MKINLNGVDFEEFDELPASEKIKHKELMEIEPEVLKRKKKKNKPKRGTGEK